jgi:hypothetical protein
MTEKKSSFSLFVTQLQKIQLFMNGRKNNWRFKHNIPREDRRQTSDCFRLHLKYTNKRANRGTNRANARCALRATDVVKYRIIRILVVMPLKRKSSCPSTDWIPDFIPKRSHLCSLFNVGYAYRCLGQKTWLYFAPKPWTMQNYVPLYRILHLNQLDSKNL